jgi:hypothetical protein
LSAAARAGHTRVVALLLDRGAEVNAVSRGETALHEGIDHPEVAALLVSRGASVSSRDYEGKTPLHDVGYDGGAVFDADCKHIVWRASRPKPGKELDEYRRLLGQQLVRPQDERPDADAMSDPFRGPWLSPDGLRRLSERFRRDHAVPARW